jgi:hypothetical protein
MSENFLLQILLWLLLNTNTGHYICITTVTGKLTRVKLRINIYTTLILSKVPVSFFYNRQTFPFLGDIFDDRSSPEAKRQQDTTTIR